MFSRLLRGCGCLMLCGWLFALQVAYGERGLAVPPLRTDGAAIKDSRGAVVRLVSVSWYGFDQGEFVVGGLDHAPLKDLARQIRAMGFNSVRLPWANQTVESNPVVPDYALSANPEFRGKHALEIMDAVINALAAEHLLVILDNHVSRADWCCNDKDGNGLWYNHDYPEQQWTKDWKTLVRRYKSQPYVVGADLRNEPRSGAKWGGNDPAVDWHAAAERGGSAVLAENQNLLVIVEGPNYSLNLEDFGRLPVRLPVAHRLVYSPHNYGWSQPTPQGYEEFKGYLHHKWGYLGSGDHSIPIWVGEFGVCQNPEDCRQFGSWLPFLLRYMAETGVGWSYWSLNGTQSSGEGRLYGKTETYGLLSTDYQHIAAPNVLKKMEAAGLRPASVK